MGEAVSHPGERTAQPRNHLSNHPETPFAASLLGAANFIAGEVTGSTVTTFLGEMNVGSEHLSTYSQGEIVNVLMRPEGLFLKETQDSANGVVLDVDYTASQAL